MAAARYGRIYHSNNHHISLRFANAKSRDDFRGEFDAYHADHDHDGEVPRFVDITAQDANRGYQSGGRSHGDIHPVKLVELKNGEFILDHNKQAEYVTIDGYTRNEIHEYHNPTGMFRNSWYKVPTSCVPPIIVIGDKFIDSNTLQRHPLSAVFGDMIDKDYKSLVESVQRDGFIEPVIRVFEGKILDGWHRYCAAREWNLIRKLLFQEWDDDVDGDPAAFVMARNVERRHLTAGQRAQIVVDFNERFGQGVDPRSLKSPNGEFKEDADTPGENPQTREELAKKAGVGKRTIDRAVQVKKAGGSQAVISGEKTTGEVLKEQEDKRKRKKLTTMVDVLDKAVKTYDKNPALDLLTFTEIEEAFARSHENIADDFRRGIDRIESIGLNGTLEELIDNTLKGDVKVAFLEAECKAISIFAHQISEWKDQDWILGLIESKTEKSESKQGESADAESEDTLDHRVSTSDTDMGDTSDADVSGNTVDSMAGDSDVPAIQERTQASDAAEVGKRTDTSETEQESTITDPEPSEVESFLEAHYKAREMLNPVFKSEETESDSESESDEPDTQSIQKDIRDARNKADMEGGMVNFPTIAKRHGVDSDVVAEIAAKMVGGFEVPEPALKDDPEKADEPVDWNQRQKEHVARLEALPGEIKDYIPTWIDANPVRAEWFKGYENQITLKLLLNARCQIEFDRERSPDPFFKEEMEDLLDRMKTNDQALIDKVGELLGIDETQRTGEHQANLETIDAIEAQVKANQEAKENLAGTAEEASQMEKEYPSSLEEAVGDEISVETADLTESSIAELLGENHEMWGIHIEWRDTDKDMPEGFKNIAFLDKPHDPRSRSLSMLPERLIAELLTLAMPEYEKNAALGWEAGYELADRESFNEAFDTWKKHHKSELSALKNAEDLTGEHVCKAYQLKMRDLQTNVITPTDYRNTCRSMRDDDKRLIEGLVELYGGSHENSD